MKFQTQKFHVTAVVSPCTGLAPRKRRGRFLKQTRSALLLSLMVLLAFVCVDGGQSVHALPSPALKLRPPAIKPTHTQINNHFETNRITVKFRDGLRIRARDGALIDSPARELATAQPLLASLAGAKWRRVDRLPEEQIESLRQTAQRQLGREIPDLNLQFYVNLPPGADPAAIIDTLNALDIVELAQPIPRLAPLPTPPDFRSYQGYLNAAPNGIFATYVQTHCGVRGAGIKIADVEASYNPNHIDLPAITLLGGDIAYGNQVQIDALNHGTASLGIMAALDNGFGTTGITPDSSYYFSCGWEEIDPPSGDYAWNGPGAVTTAIAALSAGDVLLIELQGQGPLGYSPIEWEKPIYDRIVLAVGLGIIVIEPAGNGGNNLDDPTYSTGNGGHYPFRPENDSGAIIVGAGAAPAAFGGTDTERSRLDFSNYGSTVDLQGWGQAVVTTGYGNLYFAEGSTAFYGYFAGTSSASPIVAGACALVQSSSKTRTGSVLTPAQVKQILRDTGTPQQSGNYPASENIGPLPNVRAAINCCYPLVLESSTTATGLYTVEVSTVVDQSSKTITVAKSGSMRFYRIRSPCSTSIVDVVVSGSNIVLTYQFQ